MGSKYNKELVDFILSAPVDERIDIIKKRANEMTVHDLDEVSIKLIENLTVSLESLEDVSRARKRVDIAAKQQSEPENFKIVENDFEEDENESEKILKTSAQSLVSLSDRNDIPALRAEKRISREEYEEAEDSGVSLDKYVPLAGLVLSILSFLGIGFAFDFAVAAFAPLLFWLPIAFYGSFKKAAVKKTLLFVAAPMALMHYQSYVGVYSAITSGAYSSYMSSLAGAFSVLVVIAASVFWQEQE